MPSSFVLQKSSDQQYYFNLKAANNEIILTSERYRNKTGAEGGIQSVRNNAPLDERYSRKVATDGKHYFVLLAANRQPIGQSEMYSSLAAMDTGITAVKSNAPIASIKDLT